MRKTEKILEKAPDALGLNHKGSTAGCRVRFCSELSLKDGRQVAEEIRSAERERGEAWTPIIAVTADVQAETKKACMDSGMDGYLAKPLEAASLRAVLEENLKGLLS